MFDVRSAVAAYLYARHALRDARPQLRPEQLLPASDGAQAEATSICHTRYTTAELPGAVSPPESLLLATAQPAAERSPPRCQSVGEAEIDVMLPAERLIPASLPTAEDSHKRIVGNCRSRGD